MEDDYEDPEEEDEEDRLLREDEEKSFFKRPPFSSEYVRKVGVIVALTLQFVPLNKCGPLTSVSRHWQKGTSTDSYYRIITHQWCPAPAPFMNTPFSIRPLNTLLTRCHDV